jgi:ankyrin repeat protein
MTPKTKGVYESGAEGFRTTAGNTPLMYACKNGNVHAVDTFLPFLDISMIHHALAWAASSARVSVVERLLRHPGLDVNIKIRWDTPLFLACKKNGDPGTIGALLRARDPNILCENGRNEFEYEFCDLSSRLGSFSKNSSRGYTALHVIHHGPTSCRKPDGLESKKLQACFSLLLEAGADIHQRDRKGWTPLHHAASCPAKLRLLVGVGADVNAENDDGATVMQMERFADDVAIVGLLTKEGKTSVNRRSRSKGRTLLSMLKTRKFQNALNFLECHPDCNVTDDEGNSPLHYVMRGRRGVNTKQLIEALLAEGANPSLKNRGGETPLHLIPFPDSLFSAFECRCGHRGMG